MLESELSPLLEKMVLAKASDLFLSVGAKPLMKVEGIFLPVDDVPLDPQKIHTLCYSVLNEEQRKTFESTRELNISLGIPRVGRFRLNFFRQRGNIALVVRHINGTIPSFQDLNLPKILGDLVMEDRGLILLVGGTGTGKSSTLAAMLAHRSETRGGHILTIEDPIEFLHNHHHNSLINQREVGMDTESYDIALKNAMREAPNVIMIGEIRDMESMKHALAYAETGHLCLSTLHANNANQAVERILNFFPDTAHQQILQDLSLNLRAVISQRLIVGLEKKRVPAFEIMLDTPYICELIYNGKVEQLKEAMSQATSLGCKTLDDALYDLVSANKISREEALRHADSRTNLALRFRLQGSDNKPEDTAPVSPPASVSATTAESESPVSTAFDHRSYRNFRVSCALFKCPNNDLKFQLQTALEEVMKNKGMQYKTDHPDIEVKFIFNAPPAAHTELSLMLDDNHAPSLPTGKNDNIPETLIIDVFDLHRATSIWRRRATVSLANGTANQTQINTIIAGLLESYPPRQG